MTLVDNAAHRLYWKGIDYPSWALRPERMQEVETIAGPGAWAVALMMDGQWDEVNRRCGEDLKRVVENKLGKSKLAVEGGEVLEGQELIIESFLKHFDISIGSSHAGSLIINLPTRSSFTMLARIHRH